MNVKEKVGLLGMRPTSAKRRESYGAPCTALHAPSGGTPSVTSAASSGTKAERQAAALQLWNKWAQEALGPMSSDPTAEELARKSSRMQRLEHECAALAARAQRRLEVSSAIRAQSILIGASRDSVGTSAGVAGGGGTPGSVVGSGMSFGVGVPASDGGSSGGVLLRPGAFNREMQYAVRERRRAAAYAAARAEGAAEATGADAAAAAAADGPSGVTPAAFKSRAMLDALIANRAAGSTVSAAAGAAVPSVGGSCSPKAAVPRLRPSSALPLRSSNSSAAGGGSAAAGRLRPRSAVSGATGASLGRQSSIATSNAGGSAVGGSAFCRSPSIAQRAASLVAGGDGGIGSSGIGSGLVAVPEGEYLALRQEMDSVSERLAATQAALEVQADTEAQLRQAVDLLRARLHSSGLREVDAQRRLAQHSKLEPLFDRLAECFTFNSPEEVVARLEFLEDDKLGTFDQLLRTQEEVTRLQQRLAEAQKSGEMVATRLTTEHLQGSARLQEQNEQLRQELESMENLVHRLTTRQAQLVALQTAVLQLWGKLSEDPQFAEAFVMGSSGPGRTATRRAASSGRTNPGNTSTHGGVEDAGAGIQPEDPLSMLHMIEEFVTAKSNKLAIRHFTDIQRVANHVWQQHFRNRADIRGRVVPTFEQLSKMADRMAGRVKSVQDQAGKSQDAEKALMKEVKRLQQQKRSLELALARRDEQFKSIMGVPRRERPASAAAELGHIMRREATLAAMNTSGSGGAGAAGTISMAGAAGTPPPPASRAVSMLSLSPSGRGRSSGRGDLTLDASFSIMSGLSSVPLRQSQQQQLRPHTSQPSPDQQQRPLRPASAPNSTAGGGGYGSVVSSSSRLRQALQNGAVAAAAGPSSSTGIGTAGGTLAAILSPAVALQVPQMVTDMPAGPHWRQHMAATSSAASAQQAAPTRVPRGSLFYTPDHVATADVAEVPAQGVGTSGGGTAAAEAESVPAPGAAEAAAGVPTARWSAPQRSAIEQAFLSRLERRTRIT
ncbi:hypothetical protein VOLCADRAFT_96325 [Volvox carteri f. nagariensis]|uniref:Uncharacterized protein n=1 Tax=Volvox carteri f. nagariensis TaxID=3068 RepID=D8U9T6_VOLCA|nr:uncharacterized protein VOLCADRAFT_96325 [Volvox carteri f. nagariensis]EFJ43468.1 hypothetical protein VOLCADRAFT_96325 [Volvox carteri f. nagariensis]|eukprot:XP_002955397.1 hypothetical protein VOLCADRAFT_96325 [Volvox carteri f. nagariensis]